MSMPEAKAQTIIVKFRRQPGNAAACLKRIYSLVGPDIVSGAKRLFPEDDEEDLASLYEVTLNRSVSIGAALRSLRRFKEVEYAHLPQERFPG